MTHDLGLQVSSIEFAHECMGYVIGFDVSVENSALHVLDYNPFINDDDGSSYCVYMTIYVMKRLKFFQLSIIAIAIGLIMLFVPKQVEAYDDAQMQAQSGVFVTVTYSEPINVRGGPSTVYYPVVGRVSPGDVFPALGVSPGREWVQISYPSAPGGVGWLYAIYVSVEGGELQIVEPPPTATPIATATINPTFAAAFIFQPTATRPPTFTPPPPLDVPQFEDKASDRPKGVASGWFVSALLLIGGIGYLFVSFLYKR